VSPPSVGLSRGPRRRVPGLRREELALLAGLSVEYYQRIEQGRATSPSEAVLRALGDALALDGVERAHLHALATIPRTGGSVPAEHDRVRPELHEMLELMDRVPALIISDVFDVLAANEQATRLFSDLLTARPKGRNMARSLFLNPAARAFYVDWDDVAVATVGELRRVAGRRPDDQQLRSLLATLHEESAGFRKHWSDGHVELRASGRKSFRHSELGQLTLNYENFDLPGDARQRLVAFLPVAKSTAITPSPR
jgi:transcriptional regulator with XRE-family HTH domain